MTTTIAPKEIADQVASLLLEIGAVTFRFDPPYTFTSGLKSPIYLDNRLIISYPKVRNKIIDCYVKVIKDQIGVENVEYISGTATAAIPTGAWIADRLNLPMVYVRSSAKAHGKGNQVEGFLKKGAKTVVVEDIFSTAKSSVANALAIRELGGEVEYMIAITTYETKQAQDSFIEHNLKTLSLTTCRLIAEKAFEENRINEEEKNSVMAWFADPPAWAEKYSK